jgi:hypothetical protein
MVRSRTSRTEAASQQCECTSLWAGQGSEGTIVFLKENIELLTTYHTNPPRCGWLIGAHNWKMWRWSVCRHVAACAGELDVRDVHLFFFF